MELVRVVLNEATFNVPDTARLPPTERSLVVVSLAAYTPPVAVIFDAAILPTTAKFDPIKALPVVVKPAVLMFADDKFPATARLPPIEPLPVVVTVCAYTPPEIVADPEVVIAVKVPKVVIKGWLTVLIVPLIFDILAKPVTVRFEKVLNPVMLAIVPGDKVPLNTPPSIVPLTDKFDNLPIVVIFG